MTALAPAVESFFTEYLTAQRGASPHTTASYRDTLRLLFTWIREQSGTRPSDLDFTDVDAATVSGFLAMLEKERHNTGKTLSQRLAAIHSLFRHAAVRHPEHAALISRVIAVPTKRFDRAIVTYLTAGEVDALLAAPDRSRWIGRRDHALLTLAIQTGLRVTELTSLRCQDAHLGTGPHVQASGKGRICRIRHIPPYVAPKTMLRRRSGGARVGWDRACRVNIFRVG